MNQRPAQTCAIGAVESGIAKVAVVGAGAMGSGIAAQFANAGIPVVLLDVAGAPEKGRNAAAEQGVARQIKSRGFMGASGPPRVVTGNIEDDLALLGDVDWIVEAIVERIDLKRDLYRKIDAVRKPGSIVSSNTSTILRSALIDGQSPAFTRDFFVTHFFNPPRVMQLVEIVSGSENDPQKRESLAHASEVLLGKKPILCADSPGFIANRIGCFWMAVAAIEAIRQGMSVEEADAAHAAFGTPRTGVFGLFDLVGIDLVPQVWSSLMDALPNGDEIHAYDLPMDDVFQGLLTQGDFGRKTGAGFYRKAPDGARETLDLSTQKYRPTIAVDTKSLAGGDRDLAALLEAKTPLGEYAWSVFAAVVAYAAEHGPKIASRASDVDTAIELGYAWRSGPLALAEKYGLPRITARFEKEGREVPDILAAAAEFGGFSKANAPSGFASPVLKKNADEHLSIAQLRANGDFFFSNDCASLWDAGDGVACFEIHTKMNTFAPGVQDALKALLDMAGGRLGAVVLGNDDPRAFSAGADLGFILGMIDGKEFTKLDDYITCGQSLFLAMKYTPIPVVAAMHGFALGGGCEFALHADAIVAHSELTAGLPEANVGLIPAWGGCTQLLLRASLQDGPKGPVAEASRAMRAIFPPALSGSAEEAREIGYLRADDGFVMHRGMLLAAARDRARQMISEGYEPPDKATLKMAGASAREGVLIQHRARAAAGALSAMDMKITEALADVLTGGSHVGAGKLLSEADVMSTEKEALLSLAGQPETVARMEHMLRTGKPLRN